MQHPHPPTGPAHPPCPASLHNIALWGALILGIPSATLAQGPNQDGPAIPALCQQLAEQGLNTHNLAQWQEAILECQHQAPWLARLGHHLNQIGQYREAANHLERALLLDSTVIDVQIDYAIALAGLGDKTSALALLQDLLQNPQLPPALANTLAQQQTRLSQAPTPPTGPQHWRTQTQLSAIVGRDSNLLGAPNLSSLALTLGNGTQILPLESNYLAKAGPYHRVEAVVHAKRQNGHAPQWELLASLRQRNSPNLAQAQSTQYELTAERSTTPPRANSTSEPGTYMRITLAGLDTQQSGRYTVQGLAAGLGHNTQTHTTRCQWRAGAELQTRHYATNNSLSGQYQGLSLNMSCQQTGPQGNAQPQLQWHASLRSGKDHPQDSQRAGGTQTQTALFVQLQAPSQLIWTGSTGQWRLSAEWALSQDQQTYSPLLLDGEARKISKKAAKIEYTTPLNTPTSSQAWQAFGGLEWAQHSANISLFGLRSWGPYLGLRYAW